MLKTHSVRASQTCPYTDTHTHTQTNSKDQQTCDPQRGFASNEKSLSRVIVANRIFYLNVICSDTRCLSHIWSHAWSQTWSQTWFLMRSHTWFCMWSHEWSHTCSQTWSYAWSHARFHAWFHVWFHVWRHDSFLSTRFLMKNFEYSVSYNNIRVLRFL